MIQLKVRAKDLIDEIVYKIEGFQEFSSIATRTELAKAVFTITSKKFLHQFSLEAMTNPTKYSHLYEWGESYSNRNRYVGNERAYTKRLFKILRKSVTGGALTIGVQYLPARAKTPIPELLLQAGKTGKYVQKSGVFTKKASIVESGKPVTFTTKQYIAFLSQDKNSITFLPPNKTVLIQHPGGIGSTNALTDFFEVWFSTYASTAVEESGMFTSLSKTVAKALNVNRAGKNAARMAIRETARRYSMEKVEI
jgi:hypothetical protein